MPHELKTDDTVANWWRCSSTFAMLHSKRVDIGGEAALLCLRLLPPRDAAPGAFCDDSSGASRRTIAHVKGRRVRRGSAGSASSGRPTTKRTPGHKLLLLIYCVTDLSAGDDTDKRPLPLRDHQQYPFRHFWQQKSRPSPLHIFILYRFITRHNSQNLICRKPARQLTIGNLYNFSYYQVPSKNRLTRLVWGKVEQCCDVFLKSYVFTYISSAAFPVYDAATKWHSMKKGVA